MNKYFNKKIIILIGLIIAGNLPAQEKYREYKSSRGKIFGITDRAAGIHNAGNIGLFFENRGKLYPRRLTDGPSGEFPINSGRHYIYRINPKLGVGADPAQGLPVNVIQAHFTQNEEWEAVGGYHNEDYAKVAFSDNPITWPNGEWPVSDSSGNAMILSDQDSYCVYDDAENSKTKLGIQVIQRGFAYGVSFARDILFFRYDIVNNGQYDLDSIYFSLYSDIDIGYVSGNSEYEDDLFGYDKSLNSVYLYDYDNYAAEWGGATGYFGVALLKTPDINGAEGGLTSIHWNGYYYDIDDDSLMYAIMSSDLDYLPEKYVESQYFHTTDDPYFDDPTTLKEGGDDIVAWANTGPYSFGPGDTLTFHTAIIGGIDYDDYFQNLESAFTVVHKNYSLPKPPPSPKLNAIPGDGRITLMWNNSSELKIDEFSGEYDFEGYRIYRSLDKGLHWDPIDRNINPLAGPDPIPLEEMDIVNGIGDDTGLQYSFIDTDVKNGFEYWYSVTAFDRGSEAIEQLESPKGNTIDALNTVSVIPVSKAAGSIPAKLDEVMYTGENETNYTIDVLSIVPDVLNNDVYDVSFSYLVKNEIGNLKTQVELVIADSSLVKPHRYGIEFLPDNRLQFHDFTIGEALGRSTTYTTNPNSSRNMDGSNLKVKFTDPDTSFTPEPGDLITVNFAVQVYKDTVRILDEQSIDMGMSMVTKDGVVFQIIPEYINDITFDDLEQISVDLSPDDITAFLDTTILFKFNEASINDDGDYFVVLNSYLDAIDSLVLISGPDTLFNGSSFYAAGLKGILGFIDDTPPAEPVILSVSTFSEKPLSLVDAFEFGLTDDIFSDAQLKIDSDAKSIKVVPNPYIVSSLWEPEFGELAYEPLRQLQFINLPPNCDISIYSIAGDLVKTLEHDNYTGTETWDLRADGGREIAPGIYLYVVKFGSFEYFNRFAVIK